MDAYRREKALGRGAYGTVYLLSRVNDGLQCVEKQVPVEGLSDKERADTIKEINVLRVLKHPNIAEYYDSIFDDTGVHIVMEFANGGTLASAIKRATSDYTPFPEEQIRSWITQIAHAMRYVHRKKILHRDIKSQNIFLDKEQNIKIGDFGLARVMSTQTAMANTVLGTPYYMSPELCEGKPYDDKSDVWSLGVLVYELVALKLPFKADSFAALIMAIIRGHYPPVDHLEYSDELKALVKKILVRDPKLRPSMDDILQMDFLQDFSAKTDVEAEAVRVPTPLSFRSETESPSAKSKELADSMGITSDDLKTLSMSSKSNHGGVIGGVYHWGAGSSAPRYLEALQDVTIRLVACGKHDTNTHYIALSEDGQAFAWGNGTVGELGLGDSRNKKIPQLIDLPFIRQVACGYQHSVAVTDTGEVFTWGRGEEGQIGNGEECGSAVPVRVDALAGKYITQVAAGHYHCAAVTDQGELYVWGKGTEGQLGAGVEGYDMEEPVTIPAIAKAGKVTHVACGLEHTICVLDNGEVYAWGSNEYSRLGTSSSSTGILEPKRIKALSGKGIMRVAAGCNHSIALSDNGLLYAWGDSSSGQCGHEGSAGKSQTVSSPISITRGLSGHHIIDVTCGDSHTAVLTDKGIVLTWGSGQYGRLGHSASSSSQATPKQVEGLYGKHAVFVACGAWVTATVIQDDHDM